MSDTGAEIAGTRSNRERWRGYLAALLAMGRRRLAGLFALVLLGAVTESLGLVMLVPLLGLLAPGAGGAHGGWLMGSLGRLTAGIPAGVRLPGLLGIFLALLALRAIVAWQRDLRLMRLSLELVDRWRSQLIRAVSQASWARIGALRTSQLEFALNSEVARLSLGSDRLLRGGSALLQLSVLALAMMQLSWPMALVVLTATALAAAAGPALLNRALGHGEALTKDGGRRHSIFSEFLAGMKLAKAHGTEARHASDYEALSDRMRIRMLGFYDRQLRLQSAMQVGTGLVIVAAFLTGYYGFHQPVALLAAQVLLLARMAGPLQAGLQGIQAISTMLPAVGQLLELEARLGRPAPMASPIAAPAPGRGPFAIELQGLTYQTDRPILRSVDARIAAGEFAVLLGPSGAGKTTLIDILAGLIMPNEGEVRIAGRPLGDAAARMALQAELGYVTQDPFLFHDTLRANLAWAAPTASETDMWRALESASVAATVRALPEGLDTEVGPRGARLSGGERQRICLARALLRGPRLLLLDEPTSALEPATEVRLLAALEELRGETTIVMIAHRLPPGFAPDRLFRLEDGMLVEPDAAPPRQPARSGTLV